MRLKVEHITTFQYDAPVYETLTEVRLRPSEDLSGEQRLLDYDLTIEPNVALLSYDDYFGNCVTHFNMMQQHSRVRIVSHALVETGAGRTKSTSRDELLSLDYLNESRFAKFDPQMKEFAYSIGSERSPIDATGALCDAIHSTFVYEPGVTDVHSPSSEVMNLRRGVCQDFSHVLIAACRMRGIPARYVSGYLYGGPDTEDFDRASHAWCEIYAGPEEGWIAFDPTHSPCSIDERYIKIGIGRDYADVPPVRGTYKGSAAEVLTVTVRVSAG